MTQPTLRQRDQIFPDPIVPGDRLGSENDFNSGYGTYTSRGFIYSSLVGCKVIQSIIPSTSQQNNSIKSQSV